jgi:uncharacterized membrane protein
MSTWHYMKNGAQNGPATVDEVRSLLSSGALPGDALVWREGLAGWVPANSLAEFSGAAPAAAAPAAAVPPPAPGAVTSEAADVEKNKIFAILSYLPPFLFLVPLLAARESKFAMYHCNQGLVLTLAAIALGIANMILGMILLFIPFVGWFLMSVLHLAVFAGTVALVVIGIINAANGVCKPLPVIGGRFTLVK